MKIFAAIVLILGLSAALFIYQPFGHSEQQRGENPEAISALESQPVPGGQNGKPFSQSRMNQERQMMAWRQAERTQEAGAYTPYRDGGNYQRYIQRRNEANLASAKTGPSYNGATGESYPGMRHQFAARTGSNGVIRPYAPARRTPALDERAVSAHAKQAYAKQAMLRSRQVASVRDTVSPGSQAVPAFYKIAGSQGENQVSPNRIDEPGSAQKHRIEGQPGNHAPQLQAQSETADCVYSGGTSTCK